MTVQLLSKQHLEFLSLAGGCTGLSESTFVKMPHCWKSHVTPHDFVIFRFSLLALGLEQFKAFRSGRDLIQQLLLPTKSRKQLSIRIKNLSAKVAKDNPVKVSMVDVPIFVVASNAWYDRKQATIFLILDIERLNFISYSIIKCWIV